MRINKYISHNTNYSRREADELIKSGKVSVAGRVITDLSTDIKDGDKLKIGSKLIRPKTDFTVIVYHKQKGELVTKKDDRGRKTIFDNLPSGFARFIAVGRLDFASEGLILLTDAPKVATELMKSDIEREYYLKIKGKITQSVIDAMTNGFFAENATKGAHAKTEIKSMEFKPFLAYRIISESGGYTRLKVIINEGQNRELRRFFGYFDLEVMDLKRVAFGRISLDQLGEGKWRYLSKGEYADLKDFLRKNGVKI